MKIGGGQDRHVIQMIANASLDAIEEVMRKDSVMFVPSLCSTDTAFICTPLRHPVVRTGT